MAEDENVVEAETEETHAPNDAVILNYSQTPVKYEAVPKVWLTHPSSTEEEPMLVPFTYGEAVSKTVDPDFSVGDMEVPIGEGELVTELKVKQPEDLVPENIPKGMYIAGVGPGKFEGGDGDNRETEIIEGTLSGDYFNPTVINIRGSCFDHISGLTGATFPACEIINPSAFQYCRSLASISFPVCKTIGSHAFYFCDALSQAIFPKCSSIGSEAFTHNEALTTAYFPLCELIYPGAFNGCSALESIYFPVCKSIGNDVFRGPSMASAYFPECTYVGSLAFYYNNKLVDISFPVCSYIGSSAFQSCTSLTAANLPECLAVESAAFMSCTRMVVASFPKCTSIGQFAFSNCQNLSTVYFPKITVIPSRAFYGCTYGMKSVNFDEVISIYSSAFWNINGWDKLESTTFPKLQNVGSGAFSVNYYLTYAYLPSARLIYNGAFYSCTRLEMASLPFCSSIYSSAFQYCSKLASIYLLGTTYASLAAANAFTATPLSNSAYTGEFGSIFVRASMLESYKTRANWSYYSSRFAGLTDDEIAALEGII